MDKEKKYQLRAAVLKEINKIRVMPPQNESKLIISHPLKDHQQKQRIKKYSLTIILFLTVIIFFSFLIISTGIYYWQWDNQIIINLSKKLPLPAAMVGKDFIWLSDYYKDLTALINFYQYQNPNLEVSKNDLKKQVLFKLIEKKLIENAAKNFNISVSNNEIDQEISLIAKNTIAEDINNLTLKIFGWDFAEFKDRVIKFDILANKVNEYLLNNQQWQQENYAKITLIKSQLDNGVDFNNFGEYVGWFSEEDLGEDPFNNIKNLSIGQITSIIETNFGYYIFKLDDKMKLANNQESYELSQIFVKKFDLTEYLFEKINQIKIYRFISI